MCGIAGVFGKDALQRARTCAQALQHRGPEASAFYTDPQVPLALAHCRLSILDSAAAAAQPMRYRNRYVLVHNGEVYNYLELQEELVQHGYVFTSQSDSEVILAAYAHWGKDCLRHFDGAFAFAIWDEQEQCLFAARDRLGEKPFFYAFADAALVFASEMKALWQAGIGKEPDTAMVYNYLTLGYTTHPYNQQQTFYRHIQQLPPAHFLQWQAATGQVNLTRYWQVHTEAQQHGDAAALNMFSSLLKTSLHRRMRSEVPVGVSLSGGLDSSTLAALYAPYTKASGGHAFTATFPHSPQDEGSMAARVARHLGLRHHMVPVTAAHLLGHMDELHRHQEAPVQSASVLAQWQVYAAARQAGITVMLDGQGADELLAGYHKYYLWYWRELYAQGRLRKSGERSAAAQLGNGYDFGMAQKAAALWPGIAGAWWQQQVRRRAAGNPALNRHFAAAHQHRCHYAQPAAPTLNGILHFNTFTLGLEELLRYADRNSMAHALEVRLPFLEHQLVAFLFSLPPQFKIRQGWTKWLLRQTLQHQLPAPIVWRTDKVGFEPPQQQWMQEAAVQKAITEAKEILVHAGILHGRVMQQSILPHTAHAANNMDWRYWSLSYMYR